MFCLIGKMKNPESENHNSINTIAIALNDATELRLSMPTRSVVIQNVQSLYNYRSIGKNFLI